MGRPGRSELDMVDISLDVIVEEPIVDSDFEASLEAPVDTISEELVEVPSHDDTGGLLLEAPAELDIGVVDPGVVEVFEIFHCDTVVDEVCRMELVEKETVGLFPAPPVDRRVKEPVLDTVADDVSDIFHGRRVDKSTNEVLEVPLDEDVSDVSTGMLVAREADILVVADELLPDNADKDESADEGDIVIAELVSGGSREEISGLVADAVSDGFVENPVDEAVLDGMGLILAPVSMPEDQVDDGIPVPQEEEVVGSTGASQGHGDDVVVAVLLVKLKYGRELEVGIESSVDERRRQLHWYGLSNTGTSILKYQSKAHRITVLRKSI